MRFRFQFFALLASVFCSAQASAAIITTNISQVGSDVIANSQGSVDLSGGLFEPPIPSFGGINPGRASFITTAGETDFYVFENATDIFGSFVDTLASDSSGQAFGFRTNLDNTTFGYIYVPVGYQSLDALMAQTVFSATTLSNLGLMPGRFELQFGNNTWVVNVSDVPIPAALPMFLFGIAGIGAVRRLFQT